MLIDAEITAFITAALAEDVGHGDSTTNAVIPAHATLTATMNTREPIVFAGACLLTPFFHALNEDVVVTLHYNDGDRVQAGQTLATLQGNARAILTAERVALNTLQHLSGIATLTKAYVDALHGTRATLLDTRKTTPLWRILEKYAVRMGGGHNHRRRLDEAILIKDNHLAVVGSVASAVHAAKAAGFSDIQVECDTLGQVQEALAAGATRLLLDNMTLDALHAAVALVDGRVPLEASGGVTLATIRAIAETGVDFISVGRITQSAPAVDIGLDLNGMTR